MRIRYSGMFSEVDLGETGQTVAQGGVVDVPDDVGERLLQVPDWARVDVGPLEDRPKAALLARAEELGVEGRHSMNKEELAAAIRDRS